MRPNGHIWMTAQQFYKAAELIYGDEELNLNEYVFPIIVNFSFSCELSLKSIDSVVTKNSPSMGQLIPAASTKSKIRVRGHSLIEMFNKIDQPVQKLITETFEEKTKQELLPLLQHCSDYFEKARYPFEQIGGGYRLSDVRCLAKGLLETIHAVGIEIERSGFK